MTAYQAALKCLALNALQPRKAPGFAIRFEAVATEAEYDEYLSYVWGNHKHKVTAR